MLNLLTAIIVHKCDNNECDNNEFHKCDNIYCKCYILKENVDLKNIYL